MINDDEMEITWKWPWPMSRYCSAFALKGLQKTTEIQDSQYSSQHLNWVPPKYRSKVLPPDPTCSVLATLKHIKM